MDVALVLSLLITIIMSPMTSSLDMLGLQAVGGGVPGRARCSTSFATSCALAA